MVDRGTELLHRCGHCAAGAKMNAIVAKPYAVHFESPYIWCPSAILFLISLVAFLVVFDVLESSLNWFFTLTYIQEKRE